MRGFSEIEKRAMERKGGRAALARLLSAPEPPDRLRAIPADRWLSAMTKCVFQAGFNWKIVENLWPRFEEVFDGFDIYRWELMSDDDVDRLLTIDGIVAHGPKIRSVGVNARYLAEIAEKHGGVGAFFAEWKPGRYCANLLALQAGCARMGGRTGQMFLRRMGIDTVIFSPDVLKALAREGVADAMPVSKRSFDAVQAAIDQWHGETGRPLTQISQILAFSVD
ncbi:MAG: 3-methyladenine DNA glycosylase [Rhodospirillales bacterium CG15_BIG_FIL_POST_REV_8_21_14_020_66_15]|nr:MAG: 3-methyladenine DNA glycosylase [Rhodospirillales bacterium CG15_BIG_FIL_POST_REV_8_21_14_020_66_15]